MTLLAAVVSLCAAADLQTFKSPADAFAHVLEQKPLVLAVGEYHEVEGAPKAKSAVKRFTESMLPQLKGRATSLVVETWMTNGRCGEVEKKAVAEVKKVTQRPQHTEDEVETMMSRAYDLGLHNHILTIDCDEYRSMLDDKGELDAEKSLRMVRQKVEEKATELREKSESGVDDKMLVLYGGALHNDLYPSDDWKDDSFGPSVSKACGDRYLELDLLVPQYVEKDDDLRKEPWFAPALAAAAKGKTVLIEPRPRSWMLVFPR